MIKDFYELNCTKCEKWMFVETLPKPVMIEANSYCSFCKNYISKKHFAFPHGHMICDVIDCNGVLKNNGQHMKNVIEGADYFA